MVLGIQPILLAALVAEHRITDALLGRLATVEVLAISCRLLRGWGRSVPSRRNADEGRRTSSALLGLTNLACCYAAGAAELFVLRFAAGALEGALLGCTIVILTRTRSPDRINGVFLAAQTIPQALAALALPIYLMPRWGSNASFVILAALAFIGVALAPLLPRRRRPLKRKKTEMPKWVWTAEIGFVLAAITLQTAGIGAAMEYLAELATLHGFDQRIVGLATSGNLIFQVAGAFVVVGIAWRIPSTLALLVGVALQASMAFAFPLMASGPLYVALACAFGVFLLALGPFQVAWLIRIEPTRRVALVITPMTLIGWSAGSLVASFWVTAKSSDQAFRVAACLFVAAGAAYIMARLVGQRAPREALAT